MNRLPHIIFLAVMVISCHKPEANSAQHPMDRKDFVRLYTNVLIIQNKALTKEESTAELTSLFNEYNLTTEEYKSIVAYYQSNPDEWLEILREVEERILKLAGENKNLPESSKQ